VQPWRRPLWKMGNPRWWPRNGCDSSYRLTAKILLMRIQLPNLVKHEEGNTNSHELSLLIFFTISLPSQPFLSRHLGFYIFSSQWPPSGLHTFLQLGCFGLDSYITEKLKLYIWIVKKLATVYSGHHAVL